MKLKVATYNRIFSSQLRLFLSICYGFLLISLPSEFFRDRGWYLIYALDNINLLNRYDSISIFFNEPLFLYINYLLSFVFTPEGTVKFIVFFISVTLFYYLLKYSKNFFLFFWGFVALLLVSYTFHLQLVVLRQGLATALLLIFTVHFFYKRYYLLLVLFLGFIHTSFFIIFYIFVADRLLNLFIKNTNYRMFFLLTFIFVSSFFIIQVAEALGVRQATESHLLNNSNGGGGFLLFSFLMFFLLARNLDKMVADPFGYIALIGLVVYLGFYFTLPISGRIIGSFLPFLYIYFVSNFYPKVFYPILVFIFVNVLIFYNSIVNGSLTLEGVDYLNNLLGI